MLISKSGSACSGAAALPHLPFPNSWCSPFVSDPKHPSAEQQLLLPSGTGCKCWMSLRKGDLMGSGQPSHEGFGEEGNWVFRVSDPTSALCGGAVSPLFEEVGLWGSTFQPLLQQHSQPNIQCCPSLGDVEHQCLPLECWRLLGEQGQEAVSKMGITHLRSFWISYPSIFSACK